VATNGRRVWRWRTGHGIRFRRRKGHNQLLFRASPPVTMVHIMTAGLLAREYAPFICLPVSRRIQWHDAFRRHGDERQSAYSCGGSHGIGRKTSPAPCSLLIPLPFGFRNRRFLTYGPSGGASIAIVPQLSTKTGLPARKFSPRPSRPVEAHLSTWWSASRSPPTRIAPENR